MKSKLSLILVFAFTSIFGQVPDTETFTLQNVVDVVNPTTNDLVDCFSDANADYFDAAYTGYPANSLLRFRNYGVPPYVLDIKSTQSISINPTTAVFPATTTVSGDIAIICVAANSTNAETFSTPTGWIALGTDNSNTYLTYRLFTKVLSGGEQNSTVTITTS